MPIYDFECRFCGETFEELVRSAAGASGVTCPECRSSDVEKKISLIASRSPASASSPRAAASSCATGT